MVSVNFIKADGTERSFDGAAGESVMEVAITNGVDEILADCGGALSCATCHVHLPPEWMERLGEPSSEETAMLEMAVDPDEYSRLSCQIRLAPELDGLTVRLPRSQL